MTMPSRGFCRASSRALCLSWSHEWTFSAKEDTACGYSLSPVTHHCCPPCKGPAWSQGMDSLADKTAGRAERCLQPPGFISIHTQEAPARDCSLLTRAVVCQGMGGEGVDFPAVSEWLLLCTVCWNACVWTLPSPDTAGQSHGPLASARAMLSAQERQTRGPTRSFPAPTRLDKGS